MSSFALGPCLQYPRSATIPQTPGQHELQGMSMSLRPCFRPIVIECPRNHCPLRPHTMKMSQIATCNPHRTEPPNETLTPASYRRYTKKTWRIGILRSPEAMLRSKARSQAKEFGNLGRERAMRPGQNPCVAATEIESYTTHHGRALLTRIYVSLLSLLGTMSGQGL